MRLDDYPVVCASKYKVRDVNVLKLFINTEDIKKETNAFYELYPRKRKSPFKEEVHQETVNNVFFF